MMDNCKPEAPHLWLHRLVGDWVSEGSMPNADGSASPWTATETFSQIGDIWVQAEGKHSTPDGKECRTQMTLGYDPVKGHFVGSWLGTMMTHLWVYKGTLEGNVLTLEAEGPGFEDPTQTSLYHDVIELLDDGNRTLKASVLQPDGSWKQFMEVLYKRQP